MKAKALWAPAIFAACVSAAGAQEQQQIPVRQLAIEATSTATFANPQLRVWQWPDGHVVVTYWTRAAGVTLFDRDLKMVRVIADASIVSIGMTPLGSFIAMPYVADTTVVVDPGNSALIFLDRNGKEVRLVALPRGQEARNIATGLYSQYIDPKGRIVYRGSFPRMWPNPAVPVEARTSDSTAVVRADYDRHALDTLMAVRHQPVQIDITPPGKLRRTVKMTPNSGTDDWAMLSDGSIAVVRHHDYHIDWLYADGTRTSTPPMPFDWRKLSNEERQARLDTLVVQTARTDQRLDSLTRLRRGFVEEMLSPNRVYSTLAEVSDVVPPLRGINTLTPDADNRLWITTSTPVQPPRGILMDVVNKQGQIEERVQLPANAALAGFGPNGTVYLRIVRPDRTNVLARARIVR